MKKIILALMLVFLIAAAGCSRNTENLIGEEKAKSIALSNAGLGSDDVTFIKSSLESEDGKKVYDIEFYSADNTEYDYEINASSGEIISREAEPVRD